MEKIKRWADEHKSREKRVRQGMSQVSHVRSDSKYRDKGTFCAAQQLYWILLAIFSLRINFTRDPNLVKTFAFALLILM